MKSLNTFIRQYFHFSRKQVNGFWVLMGFSHLCIGASFWISPIDNYTPQQRQADLELLDSIYRQWQDSLKLASEEEWTHNRSNPQGNTTYKKAKYSKAPKQSYQKTYSKKEKPKPVEPFDLSTADTTQLKQIWGIGSKLSIRIIKFRDRLGGFHSLNQLEEVYGLKPEVAARLKEAVYLGKTEVKKLKINQLDVKGLSKHPYISYKLAQVLVRYREQHGNYSSMEDLGNILMLKEQDLKKIAPYLAFE